MAFIMILLCAFASVIILSTMSIYWMNRHFKKYGVKFPAAYTPLFGNMFDPLFQKIHFKDFTSKLYSDFSSERYIGFFQFTKPLIILRDVELIKQIAIKDFDYFLDHIFGFNDEVDALFGNNLFSLRGQKWKDMRAALSPAFTSSKMRGMFGLVLDCGEQMANYYIKQFDLPENRVRGLIELEMKDAFSRYANDVIATSAFGLRVDSFSEGKNRFYSMGKETTNLSGVKFYKFMFMNIFPRASKFLGISAFSNDVHDFFRNLVWDTVKDREERHVVRNDMLQLLMEARKGTLKHESYDDGKEAGFATVEESAVGKITVKRVWTDDEIVAQAMLFFFAGFEAISTQLAFLMHELAIHPDIQRRLQEEVDKTTASIDGKLTYDCLQKMKYLDMVVSETLRKWPTAVFVDRKCIKPYSMPPPNDTSDKMYQMNPGEAIWIPIYAIHRDPKYFEKPEIFNPERFSDENKHKIKPFSYLPFGIGPRNCIGSRFALMEIKAAVYSLLVTFDFVTTAKTENPIKFKAASMTLDAVNGFWIGLKPRRQHTFWSSI